MATDWVIRGPEIVTCSCDFGCPCQFNSLPTRGHCRAGAIIRIDNGHFENVSLSGLKFGLVIAWPEAIHLGHGEAVPVVDENADDAQREALLAIASGQASTPGATFFDVFASTLETVHDPVFKPVEFDFDLDARMASFSVPGVMSCNVTPIKNPVTGEDHRAQISLPQGMEYRTCEVASGSLTTEGPIEIQFDGRHAQLAMLHIGPDGPID